MSKLRAVKTHFWNDNYVIDLDPTEKLLFLYLLTNENTNMLGCYEVHLRKIAFDTGIDKEMVKKIFDRFERDHKVTYTDGYVILHNFTKHQSYNTNMKKSAISSFNDLPQNLKQRASCKALLKPLKPFPKDSKPTAEYECEYEGEGEQESARVNGCPVPEPLQQVEGFEQKYEFYCEYMKENFNRWPTSTTTQMDLQKLKYLQSKGNDPIKVIEQTIQARNKSFYDLKEDQFSASDDSSDKSPFRADSIHYN